MFSAFLLLQKEKLRKKQAKNTRKRFSPLRLRSLSRALGRELKGGYFEGRNKEKN